MFQPYQLRPDTTQAIHVTRDNHQEVADWIAANIADDEGVRVIAPAPEGEARPRDGKGYARITFTAARATKWTNRVTVPIPGVLAARRTPDGPIYTGHHTDMFDAQWEPAPE
ncbi:hypothetical protein [Nocardiopsis synnemataformans]|uniref:hypothetical protein n=1 Tax=Nocardiopsis synnemataformans TaxID=61305 RepID=UPI003EBB76BF